MKDQRIVWDTIATSDGEGSIKQHAFISAERGDMYEEKYMGNRMLCNGNSGAHDSEKFVDITNQASEPISDTCCKTCLKISQK